VCSAVARLRGGTLGLISICHETRLLPSAMAKGETWVPELMRRSSGPWRFPALHAGNVSMNANARERDSLTRDFSSSGFNSRCCHHSTARPAVWDYRQAPQDGCFSDRRVSARSQDSSIDRWTG
jgi:hypothetical protein